MCVCSKQRAVVSLLERGGGGGREGVCVCVCEREREREREREIPTEYDRSTKHDWYRYIAIVNTQRRNIIHTQ